MTRKSTIVSLGIVGAVAASLGVCCCGGFWAPEDDAVAREKGKDGVGHGSRHVAHRSPMWLPFFLPRSGGVSTGPNRPPTGAHPAGGTTSSSPRGGFGATGHATGGGAHSVGA